MAQFPQVNDRIRAFIEKQRMFFVATAGRAGRVNLSPKGMDTLRVLGANRVVWLSLTGSGNETAAHVAETSRMTLMWCAFEGPPMTVRAYGTARTIHRRDPEWQELNAQFPESVSARQIFVLSVEMVQKSCGYTVPLMNFEAERDTMPKWIASKGETGIQDYWREKNTQTIDGKPTHIVERNLGT